jgi:hypothetical protein
MNDEIEKRLAALEQKAVNHEKRLDSHGQRLRRVEGRVNAQLVAHIQTDVASGMKSKDVAIKHGVKPLFVSYVAPRSQFAPGAKPVVQ